MAFFKVRANLGIDYSTWKKISTTKRRIEPYRCRNSPPLSHQSPRQKLISVSERLPRSKIVNRSKFVFQFVSTKWYIYLLKKKNDLFDEDRCWNSGTLCYIDLVFVFEKVSWSVRIWELGFMMCDYANNKCLYSNICVYVSIHYYTYFLTHY